MEIDRIYGLPFMLGASDYSHSLSLSLSLSVSLSLFLYRVCSMLHRGVSVDIAFVPFITLNYTSMTHFVGIY